MKEYTVTWEVQVDAENYRDAAEYARYLQTTSGTTATVYNVAEFGSAKSVDVDLSAEKI